MVTVAVSGNVESPPAPPLPPQPNVSDIQIIEAASKNVFRPACLVQPKKQKVAAKVSAGRNGPELNGRRADWALAEMVSWLVAGAPEVVTVPGLKVQLAPAGKPEQAKFTVELNPFCGVTVRLMVCGLPELTVTALGVKPSANVGGILIV
jgi:hypothetical protein